jgi:S1-C subfamily serine protease
MRTQRLFLSIGLAVIVFLLLGSRPVPALERSVALRVMRSVLQLMAVDEKPSGVLVPLWGGSGTIVSADGLILTNCHVALPRTMWDDPQFDYDLLVVALTIRSDEPPQPTYLAEVLQYDPDLDLAVIRVSRMLDGSPVNREQLNLPALPVGNSDDLDLGDRLYIFGYPGIGGETITFTSGDVSGFTREQGVEGRAWIKTDATIAGGNSGGTAVNEQGELVGIPTQTGAGGDEEYVDCRWLADTNGDGRIDENDSCIPVGGFINALRPVNLAQPLIEAARQGLVRSIAPSPAPDVNRPAEPPSVSRLIFAPAVTETDQPVTVAGSFPSGTRELYLFFDYRGFRDGVAWQPLAARDGQTLADTWPRTAWSGGPAGTWWVGLSEAVLPDGDYEFRIVYGGETLGTARVTVGGPPQELPTFSNLTVTADNSSGADGRPSLLQAGFDYANVAADTAWTYRLYREGKEEERGSGAALSAGAGNHTFSLRRDPGFSAGSYRLELYLDGDRLAATTDFVLAGSPVAPLGPITFAEGVDRKGEPVRPGVVFPSGLDELYALFDYEGMEDGQEWGWRWTVNNRSLPLQKHAWDGGAEGQSWIRLYSSRGTLPDGDYRLDLLLEGETVQRGSCTIGSAAAGPSPTPRPAAEGVEVHGRITDAETQKGIPDALFLVLQPGITVDAFRWTEAEVYAWAESDRRGHFALPLPLRRGETYSWIVTAQGYKPILQDGIAIGTDTVSPYELTLALQRSR